MLAKGFGSQICVTIQGQWQFIFNENQSHNLSFVKYQVQRSEQHRLFNFFLTYGIFSQLNLAKEMFGLLVILLKTMST
jgi:hypothetical protein